MKIHCTNEEYNDLKPKLVINLMGKFELKIDKSLTLIIDEIIIAKEQSLPIEDNDYTTKYKDYTIHNIDIWIDVWREKWKTKYTNSPTNKMGNRSICIEKMHKFLTNYKVSVPVIFEARDNYFNDTYDNTGDYTYLHQPEYFIIKNGKQLLLEYCNDIIDNNTTEKRITNRNAKIKDLNLLTDI